MKDAERRGGNDRGGVSVLGDIGGNRAEIDVMFWTANAVAGPAALVKGTATPPCTVATSPVVTELVKV